MQPDPEQRIRALERRLARERAARAEAEAISERATSELYQTVQQLTRSTWTAELLSEVAAHANEATTSVEAISRVLASVCAHTGWPVGHGLVRSAGEPAVMHSLQVWHLADPERYQEFRAVSEQMEFAPGVGIPGRIMQTHGAVWSTDLETDANFPRRREAASSGLHSGFGIPVLVRGETGAVLEFFAGDAQEPDEGLLRALEFIGAQIGRVMEREAVEDQLRRQALYDALTELPNRALLMERLRISLSLESGGAVPVHLLYLDLDDFKTINDSQGHEAGDEVLRAVSARLLEAVRLPPEERRLDTVARLGGDEFAVLLDDCHDPIRVAERIEQGMKESLRLSSSEAFVSVSIGLAPAWDGCAPEELLAAANVAMHEAKRAGKAQYVAFEPRMQEQARRRHALGEELHRAIINDEFFLAYQPVVDLPSGRVVGAEALVRWAHPSGGPVGPEEFIPRAEETGLILPLGAWVLRAACEQAARWRTNHPDFAVAVNVSGRQLREGTFTELVRMVLAESGLPPEALCLEMTESILMEGDMVAIAMLTELRSEGVHLAIDDFGTGYSSLAALRQLPVDLMKIDRSFVSSLPADDDAGTIAWAMVKLGHTLGIPVLAEGVETEDQRAALVRFGCDQAQGYLFAKPLSPEDLEALLKAQGS
jgi:diguanylate cyclase (GGDEF)-like protein